MSVGNRIRTLRRSLNMSQPDLAKRAKVGQSTISDLENDKKSTSAKNMEAVAQVLGTSSSYLLTGKQDSKGTIDQIVEHVNNKDEILYQINNLVKIKYYPNLPISCGSGSFGEVLEQEYEEITINNNSLKDRHIHQSKCVAFPASGDSMLPTIKDKDTVYVDLERTSVRDGKVFAICHGGLFKFKRLYNLPLGGVRIVSDNTVEFPEERLTAQEIIDQQFEIIGWAWSWQSMESW
ncbi:XRE family transcriptional regulator [Acinetobacter terrae]|uniref:Helix-turn-helix transcriptional regulator n=1 Tax=Acinetobacter terrae TaxID=2731247 RepID=A0A4R0EQW7_9GAMM|nr:S24 family peptidase [Acinetobacter terrae]TCB62231.1 helix-turn-helix transcriptional regulator [Acinetobacter terrae]